jgi:hypothetical protein
LNKIKAAILTFPRTGSSSLSRLLEKLNHIKLIGEPFNFSDTNKKITDGIDYLNSSKSMPQTLDFLYDNYNIIQHKFRNVRINWNIELIHYLKENQIPTLFLYRENYFNRSISQIISNNTKEWKKYSEPIDQYKVDDVKIKRFVKLIEDYLIKLNFYKRKMQEIGLSHKAITYEQLYRNGITFEEQMTIIYDLLDYFKIPLLNKKNFEDKVKPYLLPSRKMNTKKTYQIIPNINELEAYINNFDFETHIDIPY